MTQIVLPNLSVTGTNLWSQVEDNDKAIRDVVNGDLGTDNLANGAVTGAKIAASTTTTATNASSVTGTLTARKYADGLVALSGQLVATPLKSSGQTIATLPAGYRPSTDILAIPIFLGGGILGVNVRTTGVIEVNADSNGITTFNPSHISFHAA